MANSWIESVKTSKGKKYRVRYRDESGKKRTISPLCNSYGIALDVAKEVDRKIQLKAFGLIDDRQTIQNLYDQFMGHPIRPRREATVSHLKDHLKGFLTLYKAAPLVSFGDSKAREYKEWLKPRYKPNGVNIKLRAIRQMFNYAILRDILRKNPFSAIPMEPEEEVGRSLTPKEAKGIIKKLDPEARKVFLLFCLTGLRAGEMEKLLNLKEGIRVENGGIVIDRLRSKSRKAKFVPLRKEVMPIMNQVLRGKFKGWTVWMMRGRIIGKAGMPERLRLHDLRHTAITWLLQDGWTLPEAGSFAGHTSPTMTQRYSHFERKALSLKINRKPSALRLSRGKTGGKGVNSGDF